VPKKVNVIKVSNPSISTTSSSTLPQFDRMPRMYLELLENKEKIRPQVMNKEYDPEDAQSIYSFDLNPRSSTATKKTVPMKTISESSRSTTDGDGSGDEEDDENPSYEREEEEDEKTGDEAEGSVEEATSSDGEEDGGGGDEEESVVSVSTSSSFSSNSSRPTEKAPASVLSAQEIKKKKTKEKLQELLFANEEEPPSLTELSKRGEVHRNRGVPNLTGMETEDEDELKRELLFKFQLLKKSYKHVSIPEFSMHSDYKNMNQTYENTLRHVSLDSNVESYKSFLVGGFMLLEFILGFWLKFDMSGFTQQQILNMNQYERLLIELGEKSYMPGGSNWPVEIRLLGLIIMNAIIFIIGKMIMKKTGNNLVGLMNSVNTVFQSTTTKPKRRMRGPSVDLDTIPEIHEEDEIPLTESTV